MARALVCGRSIAERSIEHMFESDVVDWDAAETLAAAARAKTQANESEVERLILGAHFADLYPSPAMIPGDKTLPGRERGMIYGGPGCPGVAEFAVAEYAVVMGVSPETAAKDIGQALSLRHRHPRTWAAVMARAATAWKARLIATECLPLSVEAAAIVDRKVAGIIDSVTSQQLKNIVKAAIWEADPEAARAKAEQKARERGVWISRSDDHGTTTMFIKAATGTILRLYATITQLADALAALGDTDTLDQRRAKATEILSEPALADKLLQVAQYLAAHPEAATPADPTDARDATDATDAPEFDQPVETSGPQVAQSAETAETDLAADDTEPEVTADGQLASDLFLADEPSVDTEADRDTPHPSRAGHPLDQRQSTRPPRQAGSTDVKELIYGMGAAGRHDLAAKLAAIKHAADTNATSAGTPGTGTSSGLPGTSTSSGATGIGTTGVGSGATRRRPGRTKLYVHLTDETLLAGGGITRVEGFGPVLAPQTRRTPRPRPDHHPARHRPQRTHQRQRLRNPPTPPRTHQTRLPRRTIPLRPRRNHQQHRPRPHPTLRPHRTTRPNQHPQPPTPAANQPPGQDPRARVDGQAHRRPHHRMDDTPRLQIPRRPHRHAPGRRAAAAASHPPSW